MLSYGSYRSILPIGADPADYSVGYTLGKDCQSLETRDQTFAESRRCCYDACADFCKGRIQTVTGQGLTLSQCGRTCTSACEVYREEAVKTGGRTKGLGGDTTRLFG